MSDLFDEDGYPSEETLLKIEKWDYADFAGLMAFIKSIWWMQYGWKEVQGYVHMSTGGWSGNESIIASLRKNVVFWMMFWYSSKRGGHHIFKNKEIK